MGIEISRKKGFPKNTIAKTTTTFPGKIKYKNLYIS